MRQSLTRRATLARIAAAATLPLSAPGLLQARPAQRNAEFGPVKVETIVEDLDTPWAMGFLPDGAMLITERDGRLLHRDPGGRITALAGVPEVRDAGQGGLLDVMIPRDFTRTQEIYLSFARAQGTGEGTALARARLSARAGQLEDVTVIFEMAPGSSGGRHFGSRVVEGADGHVYMTIGDRGDRPSAQDLSRENGTVVRLARDGAIPADNPFLGQAGARPAIYSYGHRNPQGAALDAQGRLWVVEHGARGGDEVNLIRPGTNYGWPVISYGQHYSGARIGEGTAKTGMAQPAHYWDPSIAPSGMCFCSGRAFPAWRGNLLVGSLKFGLISRLEVSGETAREVERMDWPETERVRDIREAPDGAIWIMSVGNGALYRLTPA